jgi:Cu/Ag efflux protein CusF
VGLAQELHHLDAPSASAPQNVIGETGAVSQHELKARKVTSFGGSTCHCAAAHTATVRMGVQQALQVPATRSSLANGSISTTAVVQGVFKTVKMTLFCSRPCGRAVPGTTIFASVLQHLQMTAFGSFLAHLRAPGGAVVTRVLHDMETVVGGGRTGGPCVPRTTMFMQILQNV